jgi:ssDNA-specific exonuclease RecJ
MNNKAKAEKPRTNKQNNSLHKYCRLMSNAMNSAEITQTLLFDSFKDMPTTEHSVKQAFQRVALSLYDTSETHTLTTKQMMDVYETFDKHIAKFLHVTVDWPSDEPPMLETHKIN